MRPGPPRPPAVELHPGRDLVGPRVLRVGLERVVEGQRGRPHPAQPGEGLGGVQEAIDVAAGMGRIPAVGQRPDGRRVVRHGLEPGRRIRRRRRRARTRLRPVVRSPAAPASVVSGRGHALRARVAIRASPSRASALSGSSSAARRKAARAATGSPRARLHAPDADARHRPLGQHRGRGLVVGQGRRALAAGRRQVRLAKQVAIALVEGGHRARRRRPPHPPAARRAAPSGRAGGSPTARRCGSAARP